MRIHPAGDRSSVVGRSCRTSGLLAVLLLGTTLALPAGDPGPDRPNILWITCEDASPDLGCYGNDYACTPVLDRLAKEGVLYQNAFGVTGVCAPNRSCLITGVYPSTLGSHDMRSTTCLPAHVKCFPEYLQAAGYYCSNNVKTDYNFPVPPTAWNESSRKAHWRGRRPGQPFFSVFNFTVCHESQIRQPDASFFKKTARLTREQRHDPAGVPLPPFHPDTPEVRQNWARYHDLITAMDYQAGDILSQLHEDGLADSTIVFFFSDHGAGMPGVKKWVWEAGLHVPLIIRFPPQFRRWAPGSPGSRTGRLVSFVDFAPTVLSLAGVPIPAHMQGKAFLGPAAGEPRQHVYAIRDRMAERYDTVRVVRDGQFQYLRNFLPHRSWSQHVSYTHEMPTMQVWERLARGGKLDSAQGRYFLPVKPVEELYDTHEDPHQLHNLASDPARRDTLQQMRRECVEWMRRTGDLGLLPEYEFHQRARGQTPYDVALDPKRNPVARLAEVATLANRKEPERIRDLVDLLEDEEPAVRYWGAVGLVSLGRKARPAEAALLQSLQDPAPNVRVASAEAIATLGRLEVALPVLVESLRHETAFIRLRAANVLDRLGESARPALPAIRNARPGEKSHVGDYVGRMVQYIPRKLKEAAPTETTGESSRYAFDGKISREVLESYLARSITFSELLHGKGNVDDNIRLLEECGVKFAGRAIYRWGGEAALEALLEKADAIARKVHEADPEIIIQAAAFEIVTTQVARLRVPPWVFREFGMEPEERNFRYESMIYPDGHRVNHWSRGASVPDMSRLETRMWFYYLVARYVEIGVEAIHFGQVEIMDDRDPDHRHWLDMLERVRKHAAREARRHLLVCDAHVPSGGLVHGGKLMFDFHSFPLRIEEVTESPHQGILKTGYLDSIFGRSRGGITPSGWKCEHLPFLVELDNFEPSGRAGQNIGGHWIWGWDEISWFAHQSEEYRNSWLRYAWDWIREHDPAGYLQMPGSRTINPAVDGRRWYFANRRSDACPGGFGQEDTIRRIWESHEPSKEK